MRAILFVAAVAAACSFPLAASKAPPAFARGASTSAIQPGAARPLQSPMALSSLVAPSDPLASQDLRFDARFADVAIRYSATRDARQLDELAALPAAAHLLRHARQFAYDVPRESTAALVRDLLKPAALTDERIATCRRSLEYFSQTILADPAWVGDVLRALPADFRFRGTSLFLTCGYDIGVALPSSASLNGAHSKFAQHPRELLYYAIHELHHAGFMAYHPPRRLADLETCADVLAFAEYATQLEGMAVHAAAERRRREGALADDADYVALADEAAMAAAEARYADICERLRRRRTQPADAEAMRAIEQLSGERLWYRVGARMAQRIERAAGRDALTRLVVLGPSAFVELARHAAR